jgi:hypothetical protein
MNDEESKLYTPTEKLLIVLFGPILIVVLALIEIFPFYAGAGFKKRIVLRFTIYFWELDFGF